MTVVYDVAMQSDCHNSTPVVVNSGASGNSLGVIRGLGRRGIPVIYLDSEKGAMVRHSRYISRHLNCPSLREGERGFIDVLLNLGRGSNRKMLVIPTGDREVLALSKYKKELEQFYFLPVPDYEIVRKLVNKRLFYKLLSEMQVPHPKTCFLGDLGELETMGGEVAYPYIIKPAYSPGFQEEFGCKCFVINSSRELARVVQRLGNKNLELLVQEIIPGAEIYEFYVYLNRKSEPMAICGWDKIRHYPPDFGSGSFCKSAWCPSAIEAGISLLKAIDYCGIAEPELKKDPRDGKYKLIEINARTTLQNRLAAASGVDIEYIAYLDATGQSVNDLTSPCSNVLWVDDFVDLASCLMNLKRGHFAMGELADLWKPGKVHSVAAWDDPLPLAAHALALVSHAARRLGSRIRGA